ncbi:MAG: VOC family protein [Bacteroidota bacterium]
MNSRQIDHIVYTVFDLEEAMNSFQQKLGVRPVFGGYHKTEGTKNALLKLDQGIYLELLAADDDNKEIAPPRWMGVDFLTQAQISRWALKSDNLQKDAEILQAYNPDMGQIKGGSRAVAGGGLLQWELIMPLSKPEVEVLPFMVDWSQTEVHPFDQLPEMDCRLEELYMQHPDPVMVKSCFEKLGVELRVDESDKIGIRAVIQSPRGRLEI